MIDRPLGIAIHSPFVRRSGAYNGFPRRFGVHLVPRRPRLESLLAKLDDHAAVPRAAARGRVPVLLPVALDQTYDYLLPPDLSAAPGAFVLVPFGPQNRIGVVWDAPVGEGMKP